MTPYISELHVLEAVRFMDIKFSPIFIALHVTFLFIDIRLQYYTSYCASSNSVTWRGYTKSVSHSVWQVLSVCHAWCLYLIVADSVWVGPTAPSRKAEMAMTKPLGSILSHKVASGLPCPPYSYLLELVWPWWSAPHSNPKRDQEPAVIAFCC